MEPYFYNKILEFPGKCEKCLFTLNQMVYEQGYNGGIYKHSFNVIVCPFCGNTKPYSESHMTQNLKIGILDEPRTEDLSRIKNGIKGIYRRPYMNGRATLPLFLIMWAPFVLIPPFLDIRSEQKFEIYAYITIPFCVIIVMGIGLMARLLARRRWMKEVYLRFPQCVAK